MRFSEDEYREIAAALWDRAGYYAKIENQYFNTRLGLPEEGRKACNRKGEEYRDKRHAVEVLAKRFEYVGGLK